MEKTHMLNRTLLTHKPLLM